MTIDDLYLLFQVIKRMMMVREVVLIPKCNHSQTIKTVISSQQPMRTKTWNSKTNLRCPKMANKKNTQSMANKMTMATTRARITSRRETT